MFFFSLFSQEEHIQIITRICRICKGSVGLNPMTLNTTRVVTLLETAYDYDFTQDLEDIHPQHICKGCFGKLNRNSLFKKRRAGAPKKRPVLPELSTFVPHSAECELCSSRKMNAPMEEPCAETSLVRVLQI